MRSQWPSIARAKAPRDPARQDDPAANFYRILGLRPGVDAEKIKAAYRTLAKRFHPDANAGDTAAEQRTKEINRAYQTLGDPEARAAYDAELAWQRTGARGRFWRGVAAGVATFALMASGVALMTPLVPHSSLPRPEIGGRGAPAKSEGDAAKPAAHGSAHADVRQGMNSAGSEIPDKRSAMSSSLQPFPTMPKAAEGLPRQAITPSTPRDDAPSAPSSAPTESETGLLPGEDRRPRAGVASLAPPRIADPPRSAPTAAMAAQAPPRSKPANWKLYLNASSGFSLRYPADVFQPAGADAENRDHLLMSRDGRAILRISSHSNRATTTLAEYRRALLAGRYADAKFDYTPQHSDWFVLSGTVGEEMFYERITLACQGRSIHGWLMVYPRAERGFYDAIVEEIHRSYRHGPSASGRCDEPPPHGVRLQKRGEQPEAAAADTRQF